MNSLSAVTWKDMMEWKFHSIPEWKKALITKVLGIIYIIIYFVVIYRTIINILCLHLQYQTIHFSHFTVDNTLIIYAIQCKCFMSHLVLLYWLH